MVDQYDDGRKTGEKDRLKPLNLKEKPKRITAVALTESEELGHAPTITAAGRGIIAEKILQLAFENGIKVREDSALAEMLAAYTINGARAVRQEAITGSIEAGKSADFIVLDRDLFALVKAGTPEQIAQTRVEQTVFMGETVYRKP